MTDTLSDGARRFTDRLEETGRMPKSAARNKTIRSLLMQFHGDTMRVAVGADAPELDALEEAAAAIQRLAPAGVEDALTVRERVFVRLLRAGSLAPAWTLAEDDSAGVVRGSRPGIKWAGGTDLNVVLPLTTLVERGTVYAWLPGFRDARWGVPDALYDLTDRVQLELVLEHISLVGNELIVGGSAHFGVLAARVDDDVFVVFRGPGEEEHRVRAERARTPGLVGSTGPDLTRFSWAGWHAVVDVGALGVGSGRWSMWVELVQSGVRRDRPLGTCRGSYAKEVCMDGPIEVRGRAFRLTSGRDGAVLVSVVRLGPLARCVPRLLRTAARRFIPRP